MRIIDQLDVIIHMKALQFHMATVLFMPDQFQIWIRDI